jgi:hypothetical protein
MAEELDAISLALTEYDRAVEWHSYRLHDVNREAAQHEAAAKLANAIRAQLAARRPLPPPSGEAKELAAELIKWPGDGQALRERAAAFITTQAEREAAVLPCDVFLPPATTIKAGCKVSTLILALDVRRARSAASTTATAP